MAESSKKILIYRLGSLGDTVMVLPVFHQIRLAYPDADITLLTNKPITNKAAPLESILGNDYFFDRVLAYPLGTRSFNVLINLVKQIRDLKIDTVIYLAGIRTFRSIFKTRLVLLRDWCFFRSAGVKTLIGFPTVASDIRVTNDLLTGNAEWEAKRLARRISKIGDIALDDNRYWDLCFTRQEIEDGEKALGFFNLYDKIIVASTGTKNQVNHWGEVNWGSLLKRLGLLLPGWRLVMIGGRDEFEEASRCIDAWGQCALNLCGQTTPRVSGVVLKQAKIFIGHDSGPLHLAAAGGIRCVGIYSARHHPGQWYPRGNFNKIIYHKTDCAGCELDVCIVQKKKCILSISCSEVEEAVLEILSSNSDIKINK